MRIKKVATAKHEATLSPFLREFISKATAIPLSQILDHLSTFPPLWPFPRGDLYHWIPLLNRFDEVLEENVKKYKLKEGPQTTPWEPQDERLVCGVLAFSRTLVEGCGNRSLYASSAYIGDLFNTTSLEVLEQALRLGARLGQRYYTSRIRGAMNSSTNAALLASHYNINLERVAKVALPFVRNIVSGGGVSAAKPIGRTIAPLLAHDLGSLARGGASPPEAITTDSGGKSKKNAPSWEEWGSVSLSYYLPPSQAKPGTVVAAASSSGASNAPPTTPNPNPTRRGTHHGVITPVPSQRRRSSAGDASADPFTSPAAPTGGMQTFELPSSKVNSTSMEEILKTSLPQLPPDTHYEFLQRLRVAKALVTSPETRRKILGIRILAITNLSYVYSETAFHTRILVPDQDEPRRLQLVYQLAELVHSGDNKASLSKDGRGEVPKWIQTLAFGALEALAKHKAKTADVCAALSVNVNHGVLLYVIRKMIAELAVPDQDQVEVNYDQEAEEWRDALFSLAQYLPNTSHAGQLMAGAGIIPLLCEFLQLRTRKALRNMPRAILLLDSLVYGVNYSAFQNLANSRGLDVIVDLVSDEVGAALKEVQQGRGVPEHYRSEAVDYKISNQRQQTLRALWKFMHHMMGLSGANTDHLLRNFIDSPKLLQAVKDVLVAAPIFGNAVWSATVSILSSFIHNEPTSYAIVHEAGLSQALLRAVGGTVEEPTKKTEEDAQNAQRDGGVATTGSISGEAMETEAVEGSGSNVVAAEGKEKGKSKDDSGSPSRPTLRPRDHPPAQGILPATDSMTVIPTAFGAICLNSAGLALFQSSGALERFFEVFESPEHVRCMADTELSSVLGNQFDELVRHHPPLRDNVINVVVEMCRRVVDLGKRIAEETGAGAKVWTDDGQGGTIVAGGRRAMVGVDSSSGSEEGRSEPGVATKGSKSEEEDIDMTDAEALVPTPVAPREQEPDGSPKGEVVHLADIVDDDEAPGDGLKQTPDIATYIDVVSRFLEAFLQNHAHSKEFINNEGLDILLQIYSLPSLPYDFATKHANNSLSRALHILCDNHPQLALTAILKYAQKAVDNLEPLLSHTRKQGYFAPLTNKRSTVDVLPPRLQAGAPRARDDTSVMDEDEEAERQAIESVKANGTKIVKSLVTIHSFSVLLSDIFIQPMFNIRIVMPMFQSISTKSEYESLIPRLGALHRICVWEEILMQKSIPDTWNEATKVKGGASVPANAVAEGEAATTAMVAATTSGGNTAGPATSGDVQNTTTTKDTPKDPKEAEREIVERDGKTPYFRNVKTIRFLISQIPSSITPFLQGLAKSLFPRRGPDLYHKQQAFKIGESIADVMLQHLTWKRLETADSMTEKYGYLIVMLSSISSLLLEDRPQAQVITTTLINFKQLGGLKAVTDILETFWKEVESLPTTLKDEGVLSKEDHQKMVHSYGGIKIILSLIALITSYKSVMEATQTTYLQSRDRDKDKPDYFNPSQLLVELRHAVMPTIHAMWEASFVDKASCSIVKSIIDILGIILKADGEGSAFKREHGRQSSLLSWRSMEPNKDKLQQIMDMGFPREEAQSALMRSNGDPTNAAELLISQRTQTNRESRESAGSSRPQTADSSAESDDGTDVDITRDETMPTLDDEPGDAQPATDTGRTESGVNTGSSTAGVVPEEPTPMNIDDTSTTGAVPVLATVIDPGPSTEPTTQDKGKTKEDSTPKAAFVTVDDLNDIRKTVRDNLINRALDILQVHPDVTFELAGLINNAFGKGQENGEAKKEVASTIVQSLMSLQLDEDFRPHGRTISATAHLLGLILQNQDFYEACLEDLKTQIPVLVGFIKIYPNEPAPWVANILLVVEKILAEGSQPRQVQFTAGATEQQPPSPILELTDYTISLEDTRSLFEAIMAIVPLIDRDEVLALAVTRVLTIITRNRELAVRMTETDYLQRLFHMFKRHAGRNTIRIQNCMMYILRHIIEDKETIKSVMNAEIRGWFQNRGSRQSDIHTYIRHTSHLVLRDPEAFVEVTNEICKLTRYDANTRNLSQQIALKDADTAKPEVEEPESSEKKPPAADTIDKQTIKANEDKEMVDKPKPTTEMKAPGVEKPDGVIHFLLCELLHWRDVEDTEAAAVTKDGDVEMKNTDTTATIGSGPSSSTAEPTPGTTSEDNATGSPAATSKPEKPEFRAEQHPIYIYRCFLIQCLTELLSCYNRSKIEFINFSRKSQPREAITPSKPRSAVLNYLLYDLIPMGSLLQQDDIAYKKKSTISNWAISAVVALASQTGEAWKDGEEPELLFVRKFVLESMLKAFKDATTSGEPLDARYARILSLADLFYRMLAVRPNHGGGVHSSTLSAKSQEQIARIMFEKNFIGALTNSLGDIDLNFPSARRVIKYILRPLRVLSKTAIDLSDNSDITNLPGVTDEDEISIASSLSDIDTREETPDLYRNSALGIFEPTDLADEDDPSDYDEDDEEGVIYEDEMDYDEEEEEVGSDDEISEEEDVPDEEMGVQIVLEGHEHHHDEGSEDEDEDMSEDEMDEDDEGDEVEIIDELAEIGQAVYDNPGEDDDWQSGDSEGDGDRDEEEILVEEPVDSIIRALGAEEVHDEMDDERDDGFVDDEGEDEDEDDEDDELDEEDALIHAEMDEEEEFDASTPWGWAEDPGDAPMMTRGGQPARGGWYTLGGAPRGEIDPNFRIMRLGGAGARATEDNSVNPLLQRSSSEQGGQRHPHRQDLATNWVEDGALATSSAVTMLNTLMSFVARAHGGAPMGNFRFTTTPALLPGMHAGGEFGPREIRAMFGGRRSQPEQPRYHREDPQTIVNNFIPIVTIGRWQEEARLIHGSTYADKASKVVNALLNLLVPPAQEEEKIRKEKEEILQQEALRLEEERKKKEEEERIAREKAEAEEKARKEAEEREAAERAAAEAAAVAEAARIAQAEAQGSASAEGQPVDAMEGVEATQPSGSGEAGSSSNQQPRAVVMIRGREMDITGMDIDAGFLEALPEDLREEVLTNHIRERRAAAASANQTSEISREFLEALPDDIRDELLAQEANERRRRERDAARARATANGQAPSGPVELDLASFLATLDPGLRQTVLLEQDDESLAQLPQAIIAEANALRGDRRLHQYADIPRIPRVRAEVEAAKPLKKPARKTTIQMLDKAGIATLLRLMFMPQGNTARSILHDILLNVCQNRQNRIEVLNTLLSILQEGSTDMAAVERIFSQLSVRARQTSFITKTPIKRTNTGPTPLIQSSSEVSPLMVAQQCLQALYWLVNYNEHIPSYFLSEHDIPTGLKRVNSKKGKGKEITPPKSTKYALNTLLSLLDRKMITESSSVMDQLSGLLSEITRPLTILKKGRKKQEEEKPNQAATTDAEASTENQTASTEATATSGGSGDTQDEGGPKEESKEKENTEGENQKKARNLVPPVVPESNLGLVVKILVARECSGKTFRDTLTTMQNLSAIPGAREVFGRELIEQAKILGDLIFSHLQELVQQIHVAANGTEVQGMALSKFSPASSDQAKLLRVLTALDYLFDPKREKKDKPDETAKDEEKKGEPEHAEAEIFARLYDSKTFGALWGKLSDCLTAIHEREDMLHVATILLPLIEALMVVCKNSGMKEGALREKRNQTPRLQSPPLESGMENLFFRFTEDHRKILNQMVRNNPKLMSGSFSLLVNNPKVLDFDNKRNYFNRRLHARNTNTREQPPPLQLSVRRDQVFLDSFKSMYFKSADEIKYAKLSIRFSGEEGVDAGGVTREWFQVLARQMFNADYALFTPVASDRTTFHPNRTSWINAEHLSFFKFIGRIIGKALYEGRVLDCHFSRAVYKKMLGKNVSLKDMETLDLDYYKSLVWMLENDITDIITETFSIEANDYGDKKIIDLVPNGRNTAVTEENKHEYVRMMVEYKLLTSVQEQMEHFLKGFHDIVPADLVAIFNEQELELLISGLPDIDVDDWRNNTEYHNYSASSPQIQWFWRAVRSFDKEERAKLLQFATGTSKVPLNGFKELEGMNGFSKFNIHRDYGSKDRLPSSHTCFNQIDLPEYDSYETLRHNLFTAITQGADHFGFA